MGKKHTVRFVDPVNLEIEVDEDETILEAAFRHGIMLFHGCKEGQCAACKNFLIEGEVMHDRYSTFALAEHELEEGFTLLCRAHAYSDAEVEILHWDEEMQESGVPIQEAQTEVVAIEALTHDMRHLTVKLVDPPELAFRSGQYVDIRIPGQNETSWSRAYSMANTPSVDDHLEFIIKHYPGGRFSELLEGELEPGDRLDVKGPYGTFTLREKSDRDLIFIGGGSGMAPLWAHLNTMAERNIDRAVTFYYGARTRKDLFYLDEFKALEERLPGFRFVPALSEAAEDDEWEGEVGFVSDVVDRLEDDLSNHDAYLCGPPPMIDAGIEVLEAKGVPEDRIYFDKFTITASEQEDK